MTQEELTDIITRVKAEELTIDERRAVRDLTIRAQILIRPEDMHAVALLLKIDRQVIQKMRNERFSEASAQLDETMKHAREVLENAPREPQSMTENPAPDEVSGNGVVYLRTLSA